MILFFFFFFFSSRRRHTRCSRDWSSDVCSSDLRRPRPGDRQSAPSAPRRRRAASGGAGAGSGFSDPDHCRSRAHGSDLSFGEAPLLVGGRLPGRRRERRRELQPPLSAGQPPHAASTQSGRERRRKGQRKYLRDCLSALGPTPGTQPSHRSHCPSTVPVDLVDPAPRSPLRGTRSSGYQTIPASTHRQNDPPTPQTRLPSRTTKFAIRQLGRKVIFDPARHTKKKPEHSSRLLAQADLWCLKRLIVSFSSSLPFSSSWRLSSASIFLPFSSAPLSSSPLSWPASLPLSWPASLPRAWAQSLAREHLPRAPRRRLPAPLPRFRRSLPFRPPTPRRLPAGTARCRLRNCPSRFPFHPPLGESLAPVCKGGHGSLFWPELPEIPPRP